MEIEFNTQNKAEALKLSETALPNVLPGIIACLSLQFSQYRSRLCALIHFTVDCMTVQHIWEKGSHSNTNASNIHNCFSLTSSMERHSIKPIYELSKTVEDKAWKQELVLNLVIPLTGNFSQYLANY